MQSSQQNGFLPENTQQQHSPMMNDDNQQQHYSQAEGDEEEYESGNFQNQYEEQMSPDAEYPGQDSRNVMVDFHHSQDTPQRMSHNTKVQKVENLSNYLTNSYEQKINSLRTSSQQMLNNIRSTSASSKKSRPNLELVTEELQKVLTASEIQALADCLTTKSVGNLNNNTNRITFSRSNSASKDKNPFFGTRSTYLNQYNYSQQANQRIKAKSVNSRGLNDDEPRLSNSPQQQGFNHGMSQSRRSYDSTNSQTRSLSANRAQLRLYQYSSIKKEKEDLLHLLVEKQTLDQANAKKISKKSNILLTESMDKALNNALESVDHMQKKTLTFEQVGRVLFLLKVIRCLCYDENFRVVPSLAAEKQMETKRKFTEMYFHEELWKACSVNNEEAEVISSGVIYCVIRILLDPVQLTTAATVGLMKEYLAKYNEAYSETIMSDEMFEGQLIKLVEIWKQLKIDQFAYRSIGYLKQRQVDELCKQQDQMLTFHPQIEKTSELFELHSTANFLQRYPIDGAYAEAYEQKQKELEDIYGISQGAYDQRNDTSRHISSLNQLQVERYKILYKKKEITDEKVKNLRQERDMKEIEACTFRPDLSLNSKINDFSNISHYNGKINIFKRLYRSDSLENRFRREEQIQNEKLLAELSYCTFKPNINHQRVSAINAKIDAKNLVHDFEKNVGRVSNGFQKTQLLKKKLEFISKGERYESLKKLPLNPPSQLTRQVYKEKPITQLQVNLGKNKIVTISLREKDDPKKYARNFAKIHQITPAMEAKLEQIIGEYLLANQQKKAAEMQ